MTKTKILIKQTFAELLEKEPLKDISIQDLANACGINRNTFYYHFKSIPDLIEAIVRDSVDEIIAKHPPTYDSIEDCFSTAMEFAASNKQLIYNIYDSTNRSVFERYLWKICDYTVTAFLDSLPPINKSPAPEELEIIRSVLKYELFGFAIDWINHGMPNDVASKTKVFSSYLKTIVKI